MERKPADRVFVSIILVLALPGATYALVEALRASSASLGLIGVGLVAGVLIELYLYRRLPVLAIFEHELTHAIAIVLCRRRITAFVVREQRGGHVTAVGPPGSRFASDFIALAPYILPTFTLVAAALRSIVRPEHLWWFDIGIGVTLGYHIWSTIRETRREWHTRRIVLTSGTSEYSDLGRVGLPYALLCITTGALASHGLAFSLIASGARGSLTWLGNMWQGMLGAPLFIARLVAGSGP